MAKYDRLQIVKDYNDYDFGGEYWGFSLEDLTKAVNEFATKNGVNEADVRLSFVSSEFDSSYLQFKATRWETDEEYSKRISEIKAVEAKERKRRAEAAKRKKEAEYAKYLELKSKFEKGA